MRTLLRRAVATSVALGTLAAGAVVLAAPAAAADCNTTHLNVDNRGYSGPWFDNWYLTSRMCSYRYGSYIYGYAKLYWNNPGTSWAGGPFDKAAFRVYLKKHRAGAPDPIRYYRTFGIEGRMEAGDGSYRTPTIKYPVSKWALADGAWKLDWDRDGRSYTHYGVTASGLE